MSSPVFLKEGMCYKEIGPDGKYLGKYESTNSLSQYGNGISHYEHKFEKGNIVINRNNYTTINNTEGPTSTANNIKRANGVSYLKSYVNNNGREQILDKYPYIVHTSNRVEHTDCKEPIPEAKPKKFFSFFGGVRNKRRTRKNRKTRRKN
jgi:hypothetical protein